MFTAEPRCARSDNPPRRVLPLRYGLRAEYVRTWARLGLRLGFDAAGESGRITRRGTLTLPGREGDIRLFGQAPVDGVSADRYRSSVVNVAPHLTVTVRLGALSVGPGLRLETYVVSTSAAHPPLPSVPAIGSDRSAIFVEPRLRLSYAFRNAELEARLSLQHQPPALLDLSAVYGIPTLAPARALHAALGPRLSLPAAFTLELVGYVKKLDQLAVRTDATPPALARALEAHGEGRSYGAALCLRRDLADGFSGVLNYTLSRSQRSDADGHMRAFDLDQTHVLSLLLGFERGPFRASARMRAASGRPRTRLVGHYDDSKTGLEQPRFGAHNAARNPPFAALDLHGEWTFSWPRADAALFVDLMNVTNRKNVEEVAYTPDFRARRDLIGLPLLAMLGGRVGW